MIADAEVLELHRRIVSIPSISGNEAEVVAFLDGWLTERGVAVERVGDSLLSLVGDGPLCLLDTHVDTVPPASGWSRDPHDVAVDDGKVIGLGANDAKASVAAMCSAFVAVAKAELPIAIGLALVAGEETDGHGTEEVLAELERRGRKPVAAVVGEPTGLDVAVAQKGLLILELQTTGTSCHAAHGERLGARNAIRAIARDLVSIERVDLMRHLLDHHGMSGETAVRSMAALEHHLRFDAINDPTGALGLVCQATTKHPVDPDQAGIPGFHQVVHQHLSARGTRPRAGQRHGVLGPEDLLEHRADLVHDADESGVHVADTVLAQCGEHIVMDR